MEGRAIENYELHEVIGVGAFATVFRATHRKTNLPVACKVVPKSCVADDSSFALLQREVRRNVKVRWIGPAGLLFPTPIAAPVGGSSRHNTMSAAWRQTQCCLAAKEYSARDRGTDPRSALSLPCEF
jgi:serine/threonine protein kinase